MLETKPLTVIAYFSTIFQLANFTNLHSVYTVVAKINTVLHISRYIFFPPIIDKVYAMRLRRDSESEG